MIDPARRVTGPRMGALGRRRAAVVASVLSAFNANGWSAEYPSVPAGPFIDSAQAVQRTGYDTAGVLGTRTDTLRINHRVRTLYGTGHPSDGSLTASTVAMSTWICSNDVVSGVTNNSTLISPKPVMGWGMAHRELVGNSLTVRVTAWHWAARLGKQVAAVKVIATDGVNPPVEETKTLGTSVQDPLTGLWIEEYVFTLNIASLNSPLVTVNGEGYPWVAASDGSSVARSADNTGVADQRGWSPRYFFKDTTRFAAPPTAIVDDATGNDTTGTWGTPTVPGLSFATVQGAINAQAIAGRSISAAGYANDNIDGAQVLINPGADGIYTLTSAASTRAQAVGAVYIRRNPATTSSNADITIDVSTAWRARLGVTGMTVPTNHGAVIFENLTVRRTAAVFLEGETGSPLEIIFRNITFNANSIGGALLNSSTRPANAYWFQVTITNLSSTTLAAGGSTGLGENRLFRGCTGTTGGNAVEGWLVLGCSFENVNMAYGTRGPDGAIVAFNKLMKLSGELLNVASTNDITKGYVVASNIAEPIHTTSSSPGIGVSRDSAQGDTVQVLIVNNTILGASDLGRLNLWYCDKGGSGIVRFHTFFCLKGNIGPSFFIKGDQFVFSNNNGTPSPADSATFIGHLPYMYGVNCAGNLQMWQTGANGMLSAEGFVYQGSGTIRPAPGNISTPLDPLFVAYAASTFSGTYGSGAGNGDYRLTSSSPAIGINPDAVLGWTLDGVARTVSNDNAGAMQVAA